MKPGASAAPAADGAIGVKPRHGQFLWAAQVEDGVAKPCLDPVNIAPPSGVGISLQKADMHFHFITTAGMGCATLGHKAKPRVIAGAGSNLSLQYLVSGKKILSHAL